MNRSSHTSMLQAHANAPHYHEQQQQPQQHQQHQQQQQPRYFMDQASPSMSSSSYQRASMSSQQGGYNNSNDLGGGGSNNNGQYRASQQYSNMRSSQLHPQQQQQQQQQQQPQQPYHQQHQQQGYPQSSYHPSHAPNHHHHSSSPSQEQDYYQSPPAVQNPDPTFTQRPHSRSFSGATHPHPYSQYATPNPNHHQQQQQQQQRLHHSVSAGHLPIAGHRSAPIIFGPVPTSAPPAKPNNITGTGVAPKKKDPYATAWRTYSKIAEELNLSNPDGTLYPISKEAILKYLHHQSKRIKSSNLHWYVNGLKKHQEGLGFAWDDVRYDEQVVALLKELTLHPVTIDSGGSNHIYPPTRQAASVSMPIDTSKIANLSISGNSHSQHYSQHQHHQHQQQQQPYPPSSSSAFPVGSKRHPSQNQYEESPSNQSHMRPQHHMYSDRAQPPPGTSHSSSRNTSFHSAPVPLPSHHAYDERTAQDQVRYKNNPHSMGEASPAVSNSATSSPMSSSEIQTGHHHQQSPASISSGSHVKRKRHELASAARLVSPTSMEGDEFDENDSVARGAEDMEGQGVEDMDEDHRERAALKRHASTGTLPSQARNSTMSAMSPDHHLYHRQGDLGGGRDYPVTTPSPGPRENESGGHFRWGSSESAPQSRLSPPSGSVTASSIGSTSPGSRANNGSSKDYRNRRPNGVVSSPISSVASSSGALSGAVSTSATMAASGTPSGTASVVATTSSSSSTPYNKTTVQFSEVVEYAQQLQTKYGGRCPDHSWGCVELADDYHLELSIKMYMDWAGLVASGRLTMDELPDLPEFRRPSSGGSLDTSSPTITTLRSSPALKSEDQSPTTSSLASGQFTFAHSGNQQRPRSPSSSSIFGSKSGSGQTPREGFISDSLMSRIGNPPPHMIPSPPSATAKQSSGSPSSVSARARARKMASSPSLGQHSSFQRFGLSSPPVPPVPTIPSSIVAQGQAQTQAERVPVKKTSQGGPAGQGSLRSEEMELSPDEDVVLRQAGSRAVFQRRVGGESGRQGREYEHERDLENEDMDMDEAQMMDDVETHRSSAQFKREQQYRRESYERRPEPAPASAPAPAPAPRERAQEVKVNPDMDSDVDDDEERGSDPYLRPAEVRKKSSGNGASSAKRHQHRERQDEGAYNDYEHSSRYHRSQEGQNLQHQQEPWGNAYPNDRDRDYDRVEEVRMGIKSMSSSSSFGSPSMHKSASANGPSKINQDPMITTTSTAGMMANMPNQLSRTEQEEYRHRRVEGDNDMSMMET